MDEGSLQNDIIKAQEDETGFDLLNEETFGDVGTYNDDWENEHELFAEADIKYKAGLHSSDHSPDLFEEDNFYEVSFQNDVENQLTRLVLDDDDNISMSRTFNDNFARPYDMWADSLHLDFTRCSKNTISNGGKGSSGFINSNNGLPTVQIQEEYPKNGQIMNSKRAMTVEELERMLLMDGVSPPNQTLPVQLPFISASQPMLLSVLGARPSGHRAVTHNQQPVQKLFCPQDFSSRIPLVPSSQSQQSFMMPHHQQHLCFQGFGSRPLQHPFLPQQGIMLPSQPSLFHSPQFRPSPPAPSQQGHQSHHQHFQSQSLMFPQQPAMMHHHHHHHHHHLVRQQLALQQHGLLSNQQYRPQDHNNQFQQNIRQHCLPPVARQQFPLYLQQQFQQRQMVMMMAQRSKGFPTQFPYPPRPYWERAVGPGWQPGSTPLSKEDVEKLEMMEYDGLMEQREKDWIIKIQLMQLHTDSPYVDDYYFTCWSMKKLMKENLKKKQDLKKPQETGGEPLANNGLSFSEDEEDDCDDAPALLVPQLAKSDIKRYTPVQYEGSLGKLTASSIHNPRQIIDVHLSSNSEDAKRHDSKKLKETFAKIEKSFDVLLEIDDIEKKALAQPVENRSKYYNDRKDLISQLCKSLLADEASFLHQALTIRKGAVLVIRLLPLASEIDVANEIVCRILEKLVAILKREWSDEVSPNLFKSISTIILNCSSPKSQFVSAICQNSKDEGETCHLNQIVHAELGLSLVLLLIDEMESHFLNEDNAEEWCHFVQSVAQCLACANMNSLPRPFRIKPRNNQKMMLGRHFSDSLNRLADQFPELDDHSFVKANEVITDLLNVL